MYFLLKMGICHCYVSLPEGRNWNFHLIDQSHHTGDPFSCARVVLANEDVLQQSSKAQLEMWQVTTLPLRFHIWFPTKRQGTLMWWSKILPRDYSYIYTLTLLKGFALMDVRKTCEIGELHCILIVGKEYIDLSTCGKVDLWVFYQICATHYFQTNEGSNQHKSTGLINLLLNSFCSWNLQCIYVVLFSTAALPSFHLEHKAISAALKLLGRWMSGMCPRGQAWMLTWKWWCLIDVGCFLRGILVSSQ